MVPRASIALKAMKHIENATDDCIAERQRLLGNNETIGRKDMLQSFLDIMREKGEAKDFGLTEVKAEIYAAL